MLNFVAIIKSITPIKIKMIGSCFINVEITVGFGNDFISIMSF